RRAGHLVAEAVWGEISTARATGVAKTPTMQHTPGLYEGYRPGNERCRTRALGSYARNASWRRASDRDRRRSAYRCRCYRRPAVEQQPGRPASPTPSRQRNAPFGL
ncbi:hypothetical protein BVRB_029150, partial [Beta vulgaris subsp. vulgaris]